MTAPAVPRRVIPTARLTLRDLAAGDAPFVLRLVNDAGWLRHIGDRGVRSLADARAYIAGGPVASVRENGFGLSLVAAARVPVGLCGLLHRDGFPDPDLGSALRPEHRGAGYAAEAAAAVLADARARLGLTRVAALVSPGNDASVRVLAGLGFAFERQVPLAGAGLVDLYAVAL